MRCELFSSKAQITGQIVQIASCSLALLCSDQINNGASNYIFALYPVIARIYFRYLLTQRLDVIHAFCMNASGSGSRYLNMF